jgi:hypothetical protein
MTWEARLLRARKVGHFSVVDMRLVGAWPTCAIGERFHSKTPGFPIKADSHAELLGLHFMHAVKTNDIYKAVQFYDEIQRTTK